MESASEESKEHCMIQAMDQLASEGALDGKSVGSVITSLSEIYAPFLKM